ncbi:MAG: biopolymer transporter ExbD [Candidatus Eisenbacteria bacterium]|uniref:Biopolymer transporter ExbD n=1 Tax=Eiseniibacteriota bacterium TaxID=2212470 RepID=A0A538T1M4_UNCEI|nr:MAG: biopolymer transporter ExbD [Candidatus Eisenbacteria bacterium]
MRRYTRGKRVPESIHDVNMTPLIDVSLVLVVILMITTPMAFQSGIQIRSAATSGRAAVQRVRAERIEITIVSPDSVIVNRNLMPRASLSGMLRPLLAVSATKTVVVRCNDGVPHGSFVSVLDEAKSCGAAQIAVMGG